MIKLLKSHVKNQVGQLIENQPKSLPRGLDRAALARIARPSIAAAATPRGVGPREVCLPPAVRPLAFLKALGGAA